MHGLAPPDDFIGNGCGGKRTRWVPDLWMKEACRYHDYAYSLIAENHRRLNLNPIALHRAQRIADEHFRKNIILLSKNKLLGRMVAYAYWVGVRAFGAAAWKDKSYAD